MELTKYSQGATDCRGHFTHVPTQRGICSVFNGDALDSVIDVSGSQWLTDFKKFFRHATDKSQAKVFAPGIRNSMRILLDMHNRYVLVNCILSTR